MKTSILVSVGAVAVLVSAVVFASPITTDTAVTPAGAPNRAEVYVAATCGEGASGSASATYGWHTALGSKRALDRNLVLASVTTDVAKGCGPAGQ